MGGAGARRVAVAFRRPEALSSRPFAHAPPLPLASPWRPGGLSRPGRARRVLQWRDACTTHEQPRFPREATPPMPNRLARETSPYLQQHAGNPVDWYPWGPEALERAKREDKPILLSIGYSACHWCHVMERESFENEAIARAMNEWFVSVKVDREERPDLDQVYQLVVQLMGRNGGWPLTVFLTPDQRPFFAGTYFPPVDRYGMPGFPKVLQAVSEAYRTQRGEITEQAA